MPAYLAWKISEFVGCFSVSIRKGSLSKTLSGGCFNNQPGKADKKTSPPHTTDDITASTWHKNFNQL